MFLLAPRRRIDPRFEPRLFVVQQPGSRPCKLPRAQTGLLIEIHPRGESLSRRFKVLTRLELLIAGVALQGLLSCFLRRDDFGKRDLARDESRMALEVLCNDVDPAAVFRP